MVAKKRERNRKVSKKRALKQQKDILPVNNLFAIIVVLLMLVSVFSSYLSYNNSRRIAQEMTGELVTEAQARVCVNKQPSITQNCSTTATVGTGYYCDVDATDPDNDTIIFYDNTALFAIDQNTGEIIFTPAAGDVGAHNVIITASDGQRCSNSNVTDVFIITIPAPPAPPVGPGGGGGVVECQPRWECIPWSSCRPDMTRTRTCYSLNNCPLGRPAEIWDCIYVLPPAPRAPRYKQYEFCNFDVEEACLRNVGILEDWLLTYKGKAGFMNFLKIDEEWIDISIDDDILFTVGMKRIKAVDLNGDGVEDVEFIYHSISGGRGDLTGKKILQREVILEKPIYIEGLPWWLAAILVFVYDNACMILLILLVLAAILIYSALMRHIEGKEAEKGLKKK